MVAKIKKISLQHELFIREFLKDLNGTQAAVRAGFSEKTARVKASQLLSNTIIQKAIRKEMDLTLKRIGMKADEVIDRLSMIARSNMKKIGSWNKISFTVKNSDDIPDEIAYLISEISETSEGIRVKLESKTKALELLGKYHTLFVDKIEKSLEIKNEGLRNTAENAGFKDTRDYLQAIMNGEINGKTEKIEESKNNDDSSDAAQ